MKRNDGLAVFGAFKPGKKTRPVSAGRIGVAWVITERPDTKNNPARSGESPIVWLSWLQASGGCFSKARVTFHQPVFSLRFPSRCGRQRLLIWVFWSERWFQGSSYGDLLPVSSPQQTSPLGAWASPMSPLSWPEAAGAINSVFTPTLTNVPSPPKGWKINPGNRSILAHGGERERAGGAAHFHTNQSRNQRRGLNPDQMGNRAGVLLEF